MPNRVALLCDELPSEVLLRDDAVGEASDDTLRAANPWLSATLNRRAPADVADEVDEFQEW